MTVNRIILLVSVFVLHFTGRTQTIDSIFTRLALEYPHEKIYVHTDRDAYIAGETIWMKMYIANSSFNQAVGTTVYTELTDMQGNLINRSKWPVVANATVGQIELPDRMQGGHYLLKAYTSWMMNFDSSFFFKKSLVITDTSGMYEMIKVQEGDFTVDIFPEGGRIISGAMNNIAFKAINSKGLPVDVKGYLDDGSGLTENRIDISAYHDGMGKFQLTHEEGKEYSLVMTAAGVEKRFPLPKADKDGVTLSAQMLRTGIGFQLIAGDTTASRRDTIYVTAHMNSRIVYRARIQLNEVLLQTGGHIPFDDLPSGLLILTAYNSKWVPLAERLVFVNKHDYALPVSLKADTLNTRPRAENSWEISIPGISLGNISVSVTDGLTSTQDFYSNNIISALLLTGELKGYVHRPGWYFSANNDSTRNALDLVMMTNGWRRYDIQELMKGNFPKLRFPPDDFASIRGTAYNATGKKKLSNTSLTVFLQGRDSSKQLMLLDVDADGRFELPGFIFFDTATMYFQINSAKANSKNVSLKLDRIWPAYRSGLWKPIPNSVLPDTSFSYMAARLNEQRFLYKRDKNTLEEVIIRGKKKTPAEVLDEKYTSGLFKSDDAYLFDLVNEPFPSSDVLQYLLGRVAGLQINGFGNDVSVTWRGSTPAFFVDEMSVDLEQLQRISMNDVALVKVFRPPFFGAFGGGPGGAIAVYTRKGVDAEANIPGLEKLDIEGYNVIKTFYSPNYRTDSTAIQNFNIDIRPTLLWLPYLLLPEGEEKFRIRFFNNDHSKKFRITVTGTDKEGKLIHFQKDVGE